MPLSNEAYVALRAEADEAMRRIDHLPADQLTAGIEHARGLNRRAADFARRIITAIQSGDDPALVTEHDQTTTPAARHWSRDADNDHAVKLADQRAEADALEQAYRIGDLQ